MRPPSTETVSSYPPAREARGRPSSDDETPRLGVELAAHGHQEAPTRRPDPPAPREAGRSLEQQRDAIKPWTEADGATIVAEHVGRGRSGTIRSASRW